MKEIQFTDLDLPLKKLFIQFLAKNNIDFSKLKDSRFMHTKIKIRGLKGKNTNVVVSPEDVEHIARCTSKPNLFHLNCTDDAWRYKRKKTPKTGRRLSRPRKSSLGRTRRAGGGRKNAGDEKENIGGDPYQKFRKLEKQISSPYKAGGRDRGFDGQARSPNKVSGGVNEADLRRSASGKPGRVRVKSALNGRSKTPSKRSMRRIGGVGGGRGPGKKQGQAKTPKKKKKHKKGKNRFQGLNANSDVKNLPFEGQRASQPGAGLQRDNIFRRYAPDKNLPKISNPGSRRTPGGKEGEGLMDYTYKSYPSSPSPSPTKSQFNDLLQANLSAEVENELIRVEMQSVEDPESRFNANAGVSGQRGLVFGPDDPSHQTLNRRDFEGYYVSDEEKEGSQRPQKPRSSSKSRKRRGKSGENSTSKINRKKQKNKIPINTGSRRRTAGLTPTQKLPITRLKKAEVEYQPYYNLMGNRMVSSYSKRDRMKEYERQRKKLEQAQQIDKDFDSVRSQKQKKQNEDMDLERGRKAKELEESLEAPRDAQDGRIRAGSLEKSAKNLGQKSRKNLGNKANKGAKKKKGGAGEGKKKKKRAKKRPRLITSQEVMKGLGGDGVVLSLNILGGTQRGGAQGGPLRGELVIRNSGDLGSIRQLERLLGAELILDPGKGVAKMNVDRSKQNGGGLGRRAQPKPKIDRLQLEKIMGENAAHEVRSDSKNIIPDQQKRSEDAPKSKKSESDEKPKFSEKEKKSESESKSRQQRASIDQDVSSSTPSSIQFPPENRIPEKYPPRGGNRKAYHNSNKGQRTQNYEEYKINAPSNPNKTNSKKNSSLKPPTPSEDTQQQPNKPLRKSQVDFDSGSGDEEEIDLDKINGKQKTFKEVLAEDAGLKKSQTVEDSSGMASLPLNDVSSKEPEPADSSERAAARNKVGGDSSSGMIERRKGPISEDFFASDLNPGEEDFRAAVARRANPKKVYKKDEDDKVSKASLEEPRRANAEQDEPRKYESHQHGGSALKKAPKKPNPGFVIEEDDEGFGVDFGRSQLPDSPEAPVRGGRQPERGGGGLKPPERKSNFDKIMETERSSQPTDNHYMKTQEIQIVESHGIDYHSGSEEGEELADLDLRSRSRGDGGAPREPPRGDFRRQNTQENPKNRVLGGKDNGELRIEIDGMMNGGTSSEELIHQIYRINSQKGGMVRIEKKQIIDENGVAKEVLIVKDNGPEDEDDLEDFRDSEEYSSRYNSLSRDKINKIDFERDRFSNRSSASPSKRRYRLHEASSPERDEDGSKLKKRRKHKKRKNSSSPRRRRGAGGAGAGTAGKKGRNRRRRDRSTDYKLSLKDVDGASPHGKKLLNKIHEYGERVDQILSRALGDSESGRKSNKRLQRKSKSKRKITSSGRRSRSPYTGRDPQTRIGATEGRAIARKMKFGNRAEFDGFERSAEVRERLREEREKIQEMTEGLHLNLDNLDSSELLQYFKEVTMKGRMDFINHQRRQNMKKRGSKRQHL